MEPRTDLDFRRGHRLAGAERHEVAAELFRPGVLRRGAGAPPRVDPADLLRAFSGRFDDDDDDEDEDEDEGAEEDEDDEGYEEDESEEEEEDFDQEDEDAAEEDRLAVPPGRRLRGVAPDGCARPRSRWSASRLASRRLA